MSRRAIIIFAATSAFCVLLVWFWLPHGPKITDKLSSQDLAAIQLIVHQRIGRKPVLPDYSWRSFRQLPQAILHPHGKIISIAVADDEVRVEAVLSAPREKGIARGVTYTFKKSVVVWEITGQQFWIGPESLR